MTPPIRYSAPMATPIAEPTFRDFAAAIMRGDASAAAAVLETLLALSPAEARAAAEHFQGQLANPSFLPKAMGLRSAVSSGSDAEIDALLTDCFGLEAGVRGRALAALRQRYPGA